MTNFEYLKSLDNEYKEPIIHGLPFLKWLQEERKTTTN